MICTLDACVLVLWASTKTEESILARLDHLLETVAKADGVLILPTPAISELLVRTDEGTSAWLGALQKRSVVRVAPFDLRAAAECAMIHRLAVSAGGKRHGTKKGEHYQKIKVDRQIAAIARVAGADMLITDDDNLIAVANFIGLQAKRPRELELPASAAQTKLDLGAATMSHGSASIQPEVSPQPPMQT